MSDRLRAAYAQRSHIAAQRTFDLALQGEACLDRLPHCQLDEAIGIFHKLLHVPKTKGHQVLPVNGGHRHPQVQLLPALLLQAGEGGGRHRQAGRQAAGLGMGACGGRRATGRGYPGTPHRRMIRAPHLDGR